jgi:ABC-type branched-subunit amino acid transport system substrate-binding protein
MPAAQAIVQEFQARYGPVPVYGLEVYDAVNLLIAALVQAAQPDRQRVLEAVRTMPDFAGVTGPIQFQPNGDRQDPQVSIWRVEQGQMRLLGLARDLIHAM